MQPTGMLCENMGQKRRKCPKKRVSSLWQLRSQRGLPGRTARAFGTLGGRPPSVPNQLERVGSTPFSRWSCRKYAAERATEGVPSEVMEFET